MIVIWERWEQTTPNHWTECPEMALVEAINKALDSRHARDVFLKIWKYWWQTFPNACVLATMTQDEWKKCHEDDVQEFRLWFGEPNCFSTKHVDSMGHNLIVHISARTAELKRLIWEILPKDNFKEGLEKSLKEEKRITGCQDIITWRRI